MRKIFLSALALSAMSFNSFAAQPSLARSLKDSLGTMKSIYEATYAPADWKAKVYGWNLETEYQNAIAKIDAKDAGLTQADVISITNDFIYAMKDYHVSVSYVSTETATLPLNVRRAEGKYFITFIDKAKLSDTIFPFNAGDEIVSFDGKPTDQAVQEVKAVVIANVTETDQALAELMLTRRRKSRGFSVPQGPVWVSVKAKDSDKIETRQLIWEYTPEKVLPFSGSSVGVLPNDISASAAPSSMTRLLDRSMSFDTSGLSDKSANPFWLGTRTSYLPALGKKIWETDAANPFDAYLYKNAAGKLVGVVRIPSYVPANVGDALKAFSKIVTHFEAVADGLVIDQLNNPGGSVFYLYTLASMLSNQPLKTPLHRMSITPADVMDSVNVINELASVKDDESAKKVIGETLGGYPVSYQLAEFFRGYANFNISEWNAGRTFTRPYWIAGVDAINPAETVFSKPVLVLVNELDFSGGDFFPTILQDNGRAKIMGTRTAGAGGYVVGFNVPNLCGIDGFRVTQSLAKRVSDNPIENLGVTPDIDYALSAADFQDGFKPFKKKVQESIDSML